MACHANVARSFCAKSGFSFICSYVFLLSSNAYAYDSPLSYEYKEHLDQDNTHIERSIYDQEKNGFWVFLPITDEWLSNEKLVSYLHHNQDSYNQKSRADYIYPLYFEDGK